MMFFYRIRLFSLFGFDVYVDASWLLLAVLIAWSLAIGAFPNIVSGLTPAAYWSMAVVATIGLLFSIVFHEMSHAAVAQRFGVPIRGITLFIFGGVAEMHSEPTSAEGIPDGIGRARCERHPRPSVVSLARLGHEFTR